MSLIDGLRYDGKRVLVVGGATGMGAAAAKGAAELGAEVIVMDRADVPYPTAQSLLVDLQDGASVDEAIDQVSGPVHAVFSAAGVADGTGLMRINFIAHRHLINRLLADGRLSRGGAICMISSVAGLGWEGNLPILREFLATSDYDDAAEWVAAHDGTNNYLFAKQALIAYVAYHSLGLMQQGIRINSVSPGPTDTPLARASGWLPHAADYREVAGSPALLPQHVSAAMLFLNSELATGITGVDLLVDCGQTMASRAGSYAAGKPLVDALMGRDRA